MQCLGRKGGLLGHLFIPLKGVLSTANGVLHSPRSPPVGATISQSLCGSTINEARQSNVGEKMTASSPLSVLDQAPSC
jgi:hypothetical protein